MILKKSSSSASTESNIYKKFCTATITVIIFNELCSYSITTTTFFNILLRFFSVVFYIFIHIQG